ncbi:MAG: hypothetical protein BWX92_02849 [Deltaproteobacteria bacterium ADurb.Bin135]|nr:MAG: hypothetical protein BWX92_02849 [Deltaproteobacteria bacterium ADurb.Bin135]
MVDRSAWSSNYHMSTGIQGPNLAIYRLATINRENNNFFSIFEDTLQFCSNLYCEFAGRTQDDYLWFFCSGVDRFQNWQSKSKGFPCPGLCLANDVSAFKNQRDGLCLNRGHLVKFKFTDSPVQFFRQVQIFKSF